MAVDGLCQPEVYAKGDIAAGANWNGYTFRARLQNPDIQLRLSQGRLPDLDGQRGHPQGRKNVENAKLFLNFIMDPENAAMLSAFARYANGIKGSEKYMPADMQDAPELTLPEGNKGVFLHTCPPEVNEIMTQDLDRGAEVASLEIPILTEGEPEPCAILLLIAASPRPAAARPSRPRRGRAQHLQLGQLHQPRADQEVRAANTTSRSR